MFGTVAVIVFLVFLCLLNRKTADDMWFFFQAEDGIRDLVRSRGLGDVYKRQLGQCYRKGKTAAIVAPFNGHIVQVPPLAFAGCTSCLLYTSDAADERSSVDLGGRRIIKKKSRARWSWCHIYKTKQRTHTIRLSQRRSITKKNDETNRHK